MAELLPHYFTEGSTRFILSLPDVYGGNGYTIGQALGITKAPDGFVADDDDAGLSVSEGLRTGKLVRLRLSYREGSRSKSTKIVCPTGKVSTAINSIQGKTYDSKKVISAGIPRRRRLG